MASAVLAWSVAPASAGDSWKPYVNVRYAFAICYPPTLLIAQGEADNSDGKAFKAADGAELRAFGSNNALDRTLDQELVEQTRYLTGAKGRITYRAAKANWVVASGNDGAGNLFYAKTFQRSDQFVTFQLAYPNAQAARYQPVVERLAACFRLTERGD